MPKPSLIHLVRPLGLLTVALLLMGAADGSFGAIEPFFSPALIVTIGFFVWKEVHAMRQNEKEVSRAMTLKVGKAMADIDSIKQLLNGYSQNNGVLQSLDSVKRAFSDAQLWMTRVGDHLEIPYERRSDMR